MKNKVCQLVPAILLTSALVGCGGGGAYSPPAATNGTVTVNVTGTSAGSLRANAQAVYFATFSSGQAVPADFSTIVAGMDGFAGGTLITVTAPNPTAILAAGNYGILPVVPSPDTCQVTTLTNATADTIKLYSGSDTNNLALATFGTTIPIIPITLTGGDAIINITCNQLPV